MNGRLGAAIVDVDQPHQERGHAAHLKRGLPAGEAVEHLGPFLPHRGHDRRALAPAAQRLRHGRDGLGHSQSIAAEVIAQLVQRHGTHLTAWVRIHRLVSRMRNRRKEAGGLERLRDPPAPSSFWGRMKRRLWCGRGQYRSTNSELAARAWPPLPSSEPRSLPPPPFAFDHPPQSLTARWAAKLLARAATGECKGAVPK